jgi:hypothetical protein
MERNMKREAPRRVGIFGQPPILPGEAEPAYWHLHEHMSAALCPADFVEEILVRDAVNCTWNINRYRRAYSLFVSAKVRDRAGSAASSLVRANPELHSGTEEEKQEMVELLSHNSMVSWQDREARYPRAASKYNKLREAARQTLDLTEIEARIVVDHLDTIERLEALIMIEQRRFDSIIREIDRRRMMREFCHDSKTKTIETKMIGDNKIA